VATLSFILPPLFHLFLITLPKLNKQKSAIAKSSSQHYQQYEEVDDEEQLKRDYYKGVVHTVAGILLSAIATSITCYDAVTKLMHGGVC
jgi:hypothetical protein